jgi:hypothetical protein
MNPTGATRASYEKRAQREIPMALVRPLAESEAQVVG